MSSFDYSGLAASSVSLIADKGRSVTLKYKTQGSYSASTDTFTGQTSSTQTVTMAFKNFKIQNVNGSTIQLGDKIGLLTPDSLTRDPTTGDQVIDGSDTFTVIDVDKVQPGDTVLLYKLHLRR